MVRRAIAAVATLTVACSLTSLDGLSGGPVTAGMPDADATAADATADAATDAPTSADAKTDVVSFCASAPAGAFCDDFENGLGAWESDISSSNTFAIDAVSSTSPTHSALDTVADDGSSCLSRTFPGTPQMIEVDVDVRFESLSGGGSEFDFLGIRGSGSRNLTLQVRQGLIELDEDVVPTVDGGPDEELTSTQYGVDKGWHHFHWTNHLTGGKANVELFVDGNKIGAMVADVRDYQVPLTLDLGDCLATTSGSSWKVRYDNVVVVAK